MRYPTKYVLVTDLDDFKSNNNNNLSSGIHATSSKNCKENTLSQQNSGNGSVNCTNPINSNNSPSNNNKNKSLSPVSTASPTTTTNSSTIALISDAPTNDLGNPLSMHLPLKNVTVLPERVWQDCVSSEANVKVQQLQQQQDNNENASGAANKLIWEITNPLQKMTCHCLK